MKAYYQSNHFQALISAARDPKFAPASDIQARYNKQRFSQAMRALRSRNIFLYTEGTRSTVNLNSTLTIYTQPVGVRMIILGYSSNMRFGAVDTSTAAAAPTEIVLPQMHRIRIVGGDNERSIIDDLVPAQAGVGGQPRFTDVQLTTPIIVEAGEQMAVDLGYDQAAANAPTTIPPEAFIFFGVTVKDQLTQIDRQTVDDVKRWIANENFQRAIRFNCVALGQATTGIAPGSAAGTTATCLTAPANVPVLITGIGMTLSASRLTIIDTADGSSFSLNRPMQSSALNMPDYENRADVVPATYGAPVVAPIWESYQPLPVPHLLRRGAQLQALVVVGGDAGAGANTIIENGSFNQLVFSGITV